MKPCTVIIIVISIFAMLPLNDALGEWPRADEGFGPPYVGYDLDGTCGDFIRAKEEKMAGNSFEHFIFYAWTKGYITGLNSELDRGGNVLGSNEANFDDFMILVENYCRNNPLDYFANAVSVPLNSITPVDWEGKSYTK